MRRILLAGVCLLMTGSGVFAQNKTLGVGVASPNPNAALHVESPTGNQGFIMPRLTSVQREAMTALLKDADKGLMLYDTDLYTIFIWDGTAWGNTSQFTIDDPASSLDAISVLNQGLGVAGRFKTDNVASQMPTLWAETNSDQPLSAPIYGRNTGTGDVAASFRIENTSNAQAAAYAETDGSGPAVFGNQIGLGRGGQFQIQNASNAQAAVRSFTNGTGRSGHFTINNTASTSAGIFSETNGSGPAVQGENTGTADGFAGLFNNTSGTNTFPAIQASSAGSGSAIRAMQTAGNGAGVDVFMQNTTSTAPGFAVDQRGLGNAGSFSVNNSSNAGPAVFASTTASGGNAMSLSNEGLGIALALSKGGMQVTTSVISNGTSLATRASAYRITSTSGTTFTVDFGPVDGEVFMVFNDTLQPVTVAGITIPNGEGKTIVVFPGGVLRGF